MELLCLKNLVSEQVSKRKPWELEFELPEFESSEAYKRFAALPTTKYNAYSAAEGVNPHGRISSKNPIKFLHGVCVDWDATFTNDEFEEIVTRLIDHEYPVNYVSRSYNDGIHAVWFFESPIMTISASHTVRLLDRIAKEMRFTGRDAIARGFDSGNFKRQHYLLHGKDWRAVDVNARIPTADLNYLIFETSKPADFAGLAPEIPLDAVWEEVQKVWPEHGWPGEFKEGFRGPTFWDPGGQHKSVDSAIVRDTGMQVFNMPKNFYTWAEILSPGFVREYEVGRIGESIKDYWFDGQNYFLESGGGQYHDYKKDDVLLDLQCRHSLAARPARNENVSESRRALHMIHTTKRVQAGIPFAFTKARIVHHEGNRYFNTATVTPLVPADGEAGAWGDAFPTIASWMEHMLGKEQLKHEQAWLAYAYRNALAGSPKRGHAHFLCGPSNSGKTLYNMQVLGALFGGGIKASEYLCGKNEWTDHLFEFGMWLIDDEAPSESQASNTSFTAKLKEHVANDTFLINGKYRKAGRAYWRGRISVTLNDDPVSMRLLPDLDMSIKDKLMIFKCHDGFDFKSDIKDKIKEELPAFARWLLDYDIPQEQRELRFGVKAYINPHLENLAIADSRYSHIAELMNIYRATLKDGVWEGTTSELLQVLSADEKRRVLLKDLNPRKLGWGLNHIFSKGTDWLTKPKHRVWKVEGLLE
tara:strand:+ start:6401 stop:8497 length:2097 start_codon:yes stop_codon:yes gene_type:complete